MNDKLRESLSALMDDEANELELERLLSRMSSEPELRQAWLRYNLANHAVHGELLAHADWDISARVQSALAGSQPEDRAAARKLFKQSWMRPLISVGVAASVALTVVIGGQQLVRHGSASPGADPVVMPGTAPVWPAPPVQASFRSTTPYYQDLAQQRLRRYMQEHAEQAALNSPQGLVPFARVPEIHE